MGVANWFFSTIGRLTGPNGCTKIVKSRNTLISIGEVFSVIEGNVTLVVKTENEIYFGFPFMEGKSV